MSVDLLLRMGDSTLILGHRLSEWCGHAPALEEDIALANIALDLIGHAQLWLEYAGEVEGKGRSKDDLAFLRDAHGFRNHLLVERPNGDFAATMIRQFLFDAWHKEMLAKLAQSQDVRVAEIAGKAAKEVAYHFDRSADLVIRLGDGTEESHRRMQDALDELWPYAGEMFAGDAANLRAGWDDVVGRVFTDATLKTPESRFAHKTGVHTEALGYLLAEMQVTHRAHPGATW